MAPSELNRRRWRNFRANRRAHWSLVIFSLLFGLSLFAEFIANDHPLLLRYKGAWVSPVAQFHSEKEFGGDFATEAVYRDPVVQCLIIAAGNDGCFDAPDQTRAAAETGAIDGKPVQTGFILWPLIPYSYDTVNDIQGTAPSAPDAKHWLGTDDTARDVLARVIYGFRLSVGFALVVSAISSLIGITAGAVQGYFGGWVDLVFQRLIEIWGSTPSLYVIIIMGAVFQMSFGLLVGLMVLFGWTSLVHVVRAEFLRARNFEYVRAARALENAMPVPIPDLG